jgi:hypothetical protein
MMAMSFFMGAQGYSLEAARSKARAAKIAKNINAESRAIFRHDSSTSCPIGA